MESPLDRLLIRDLPVRARIGVYESERGQPQDLIVNIVLHADLRAACESDRIEDTPDYFEIEAEVIRAVESSSFYLIERLAEHIAEVCLRNEKVLGVDVTVDKPAAPQRARSVAVSISRSR